MIHLREYAQMDIPAIYVDVFEQFEVDQLQRRTEFHLPERGIRFRFEEITKLLA